MPPELPQVSGKDLVKFSDQRSELSARCIVKFLERRL